MKRCNKAFTLTELLVALGVIAVLCAILLPVIFNILPNQNVIMAKRAYYATQTLVSELINDEGCYPDKTSYSSGVRVGFDDGFGYPNCSRWGGNDNTGTILTEGDAETKFATLFLDKLGISGSTDTDYTQNSITWHIVKGSKLGTKHDPDQYIEVVADVNGTDGGPNLGQSTSAAKIGGTVGTGTNYDRFTMRVYADGRVKIDDADTWAIDAVTITKDVTE